MGVTESFTINSPEIEHKLLIATQKSEYKDKVTQYLIDQLIDENIHILVIDVTELKGDFINKFDAILILHTYEMGRPPKQLTAFIANNEISDNVFTVSTSGQGDIRLEGVDGISSASIITDVENEAVKALEWINNQFGL